MGISENKYLGPFIKCKNEKVTVPEQIQGCVNPSCAKANKPNSSKFCPECASAIGKFTKNKQKDSFYLYRSQVREETDEALSDVFEPDEIVFEGYGYFIPNVSRDRPRNFNIDRQHGFLALTEFKSVEEIEWFKKSFAKEIEICEKTFGKDNVEISWGLLIYHN